MVTERAETYEAATKPGRSARPLLLICLVLGSIAVGGAAGGLADDQTASAPAFGRHLRAVVQLEVEPARVAHVDALQPRIVDALLTFLHALDQRDVGSARSLDRLKAQMLHRVRQVAGDAAVRGVLITEFALL
jgi:hypothetical protein